MESNPQRDEQLWKIAKSRTAFRSHLITFLIINCFLWAVWFFTDHDHTGTPWPAWVGISWGLALAFQYFNAWHRDPFGDTLNEYEKLQQEKQRRGL
jgi:hypothetical protein